MFKMIKKKIDVVIVRQKLIYILKINVMVTCTSIINVLCNITKREISFEKGCVIVVGFAQRRLKKRKKFTYEEPVNENRQRTN